MTKNLNLKRRVRVRQELTGESYQQALASLLASALPITATPPSTEAIVTPQVVVEPIVVLGYEPEANDEQFVRVSIPAQYGPRPQPHGYGVVVLRPGGVYGWWRTEDGRNTPAGMGRELLADIIKVVWPTPESVPEKWQGRPLVPGDARPGVHVVVNTQRYQRMLREYESAAIAFWPAVERVPFVQGRYVVTGDKTQDYGEGPSPFGFVVDADGSVPGRVALSGGKRPLSVDEIKRLHSDWTFHQLSFGLWKHRGGYASVEERRGGWYASLAQAMGPRDEHGNFPRGEFPRGPFGTPEEAIAAADEAGWTIITQGV